MTKQQTTVGVLALAERGADPATPDVEALSEQGDDPEPLLPKVRHRCNPDLLVPDPLDHECGCECRLSVTPGGELPAHRLDGGEGWRIAEVYRGLGLPHCMK